MNKLRNAFLAVALLAAPAFAAPVSVTGVGQSWTLDYNGIVDVNGTATVLPGLTATVGFTVSGLFYDATYNTTLLSLDLVIENTSDASIFQFAQIGGVAFDTNPNVVRMGTGASGALGFVALGQVLPGGTGFGIEVCVSGRRNQCDTLNPYGVSVGQTDTATVHLGFSGNLVGQAIDFSNFAVRWSDVISQQYGFTTTRNGYGVPVTPPIPEPASIATFGLGALLVAAALRRRRS